VKRRMSVTRSLALIPWDGIDWRSKLFTAASPADVIAMRIALLMKTIVRLPPKVGSSRLLITLPRMAVPAPTRAVAGEGRTSSAVMR